MTHNHSAKGHPEKGVREGAGVDQGQGSQLDVLLLSAVQAHSGFTSGFPFLLS